MNAIGPYADKIRLLKKYDAHIPWEDIQVGEEYVLPGLWSLKRKTITIVSKDDKTIVYKNTKDSKQASFCNGSLYSKLLVKKRIF